MSEVIIRRFSESDHASWIRLWEGYNSFYERTVEDRVTERLWAGLVENSGQPHGFGAEMDGDLVGFTHYFPVFSTSDWNPRCYLQDLFVDPIIRGRGIGRRLIEAVYVEADQVEASQTYWLTQEFNHTARKLYDRVAKATPFIKYQR